VSVRAPYFDTSALRPLFIHEERSRRVDRSLGRHGGIVRITRFGYAELINSMACAVFRKDISREQFAAASAELDTDLKSQRIIMVDLLWRAAMDRARELSRKHTPELGSRMLDILHVACALELGVRTMMTYDERQIVLARKAGLRTVSP
jgi:predicted nucleic acid-binding protein